MRVRKAILAAAVLVPLALGAACAAPEPAPSVDLRDPADLGAFAARIEREPERADEILADAQVDRAELRQAIFEVARDPEASREYRDAFEAELRAGGEA